MEILTILQAITIAISVLSLIATYLFNVVEKRRDAMSSLYSEQLMNNIHILRDEIAEILSLSTPATIKEICSNSAKNLRYVPTLEIDLPKHINTIKSLFFPFYSQEAEMFKCMDEVLELVIKYQKNLDDEKLATQLKKANKRLYLHYSLYDWAMWEAVIKQTTENKYDEYVFDDQYDKISNENNIHIINAKMKNYNRRAHSFSKAKKK